VKVADENQVARIVRALLSLLVVALVVVVLGVPPASASTWSPVYNVDFPDPSVSNFGGIYYAYSTQVGLQSVPVATSTDGVNWIGGHNDTFPVLPTWAEFGFTWAPTVAQTSLGTYVMYYTARDRNSGLQCVGQAVSVLPLGPFVDSGFGPIICQTNVGGSIDPDIFTASNGSSYLTWKSDGDANGALSGIWSQPLNPSTLDLEGTASLLLTNGGQSWQGSIIEGPAMIQVGSSYYLFYSGNAYDTANYAIGYTTCSSPLGPCANVSYNPVLRTSEGMSGPGGESFFTSPSGQLLMAFAAFPGPVGYENGGHRALYVASVGFSGGVPYFDPYSQSLPDAGYWQTGTDGGVFTFGSAGFYGSAGGIHLNKPIVGMASTPDGKGYWLVASDGGIFSYGDAQFYGSTGSIRLNKPIVGMASTPDGAGYWLVASDGGIFAFGDAGFHGSTGSIHLNQPIVGMAVDAGTGGYWLVASDGGIFAFDAPFFGSTGNIKLNKPIVSMAAPPNGGGYWMAASDGGVFSFGNAGYLGSATGTSPSLVTAITTSSSGKGYWLSNSAGNVYAFGDAPAFGSAFAAHPSSAMIGLAADL
jgi:predicted GH43/DUF377 family glycosyl hydrolase